MVALKVRETHDLLVHRVVVVEGLFLGRRRRSRALVPQDVDLVLVGVRHCVAGAATLATSVAKGKVDRSLCRVAFDASNKTRPGSDPRLWKRLRLRKLGANYSRARFSKLTDARVTHFLIVH
jgi:hypothetical protein